MPIPPELTSGWNANEQKLLALIAVSDARALELSSEAGEAFFRAFIVEDRITGVVSMNFRLRYRGGKDSWYRITAKPGVSRADAFRDFREGIIQMAMDACEGLGVSLAPDEIQCFEPPDDQGDWMKTLQWLLRRDLAEATIKGSFGRAG